MKAIINLGLAMVAFLGVLGHARADDESMSIFTETRSVDARVLKVKLDGVINLKLRQGPVPSLTIRGEQRYLSKVEVTQNGNTLHIDTDIRGFKSSHSNLQAELVLPDLRELSSDGLGMSDVSGFSGDRLELSLDGAGMFKVNCDYKRVNASLGGVGSMNLTFGDAENVELDLRGAGYITLVGHSKKLTASLGGLGGLNAQKFMADTIDIDLSGLGNAVVSAKNNANLNLSGLGSVTVYGKPLNRNVVVDGLGKVTWK